MWAVLQRNVRKTMNGWMGCNFMFRFSWFSVPTAIHSITWLVDWLTDYTGEHSTAQHIDILSWIGTKRASRRVPAIPVVVSSLASTTSAAAACSLVIAVVEGRWLRYKSFARQFAYHIPSRYFRRFARSLPTFTFIKLHASGRVRCGSNYAPPFTNRQRI